jgi:DNA-binding transcriptional regulator YiaG
MTANRSAPTIALADLLIGLRERVRMSEVQIARASGADLATVQAWLERREAPDGLHAQRLIELVAFVQEMALNVRGDALAAWLDGTVDFLGGATPSTTSPMDATSRCSTSPSGLLGSSRRPSGTLGRPANT